MSLDLNFIISNNLFFLLDNRLGLYFPLLISIGLIINYRLWDEFKNIQTSIIFLISPFICILLSTHKIETAERISFINGEKIINTFEFSNLYMDNYFGAIMLIWFFFIKNDLSIFKPQLFFIGTFFTLLIGDIYFAYTVGHDIFSSGIGGGGIFDGLLVDSIFAYLTVMILKYLVPYVSKNDNLNGDLRNIIFKKNISN
jgi:hypothetical protein